MKVTKFDQLVKKLTENLSTQDLGDGRMSPEASRYYDVLKDDEEAVAFYVKVYGGNPDTTEFWEKLSADKLRDVDQDKVNAFTRELGEL